MYLKTFGLGLPLPFFLKEGDAPRSYESWTSSRAAPAGRPQAEFTSRGRKARSPTPLSGAKAGAREPSGRLPAGRGWLRGLTDLPTAAPVPPGRRRVSCTPLLLQPSRACGPSSTAASQRQRNRARKRRRYRGLSTYITTGYKIRQ